MAAEKKRTTAKPLHSTIAEAVCSDPDHALLLYRRLWRQDPSAASSLRRDNAVAAAKIQELAESRLTRKSASHYNALLRSPWARRVTALDLVGAFGSDGLRSADFLRGVRGLAESGCTWLEALDILHKQRERRQAGGVRQGVQRRGKEWIAWDGLQALTRYLPPIRHPKSPSTHSTPTPKSKPMSYFTSDHAKVSPLYVGIETNQQPDELELDWQLRSALDAEHGAPDNPMDLEYLFDDDYTSSLEPEIQHLAPSLSPAQSHTTNQDSHPFFFAGEQGAAKQTEASTPRRETLRFALGEIHASRDSASSLTPGSNISFATEHASQYGQEDSMPSNLEKTRNDSFRGWGSSHVATISGHSRSHSSYAPRESSATKRPLPFGLNTLETAESNANPDTVKHRLATNAFKSAGGDSTDDAWFGNCPGFGDSPAFETPQSLPTTMDTSIATENSGPTSFSPPEAADQLKAQKWYSGATVTTLMRFFNPSTRQNCVFESRNCSLSDGDQSVGRKCRPLQQGSAQQIYFPLNFDNQHWVLGWIDREKNEYGVYDPLSASPYRPTSLGALRAFIANAGLNPSSWTVTGTESNLPCQVNDHDCGVLITAVCLLFMHGVSDGTISNTGFWRRTFQTCLVDEQDATSLEVMWSSRRQESEMEASNALAKQLRIDISAAQHLVSSTESADGLEQQLSLCQDMLKYTTDLSEDINLISSIVDRLSQEDRILDERRADLTTKVEQCRKIFDLGAHLQQSDSDLHFQSTMTEALSNLERVKQQLAPLSRPATEYGERAATLTSLRDLLDKDAEWCQEKLTALNKERELLSDKLQGAITRLTRLAEDRI